MTAQILISESTLRMSISAEIVVNETSRVVAVHEPSGPQGPQGAAGPGVPAGGEHGQVLAKDGSEDFANQWASLEDLIGTRSVAVTRDEAGRVASIAETDGRTTTFTRDEAGLVSNWTDGAWTWTVSRDEAGRVAAVNVS
jgi:YD repeat-containing protein